MKKNKGFSLVEVLLFLVAAGLVGFTGWYVLYSKDQTNKTLSNTGRSITTPVNPTRSKNKMLTDAQKGYFVIKEWNVRAPYTGALALEYKMFGTSSGFASFSSAELDASDAQCKVDLNNSPGYGGGIRKYAPTDKYLLGDGTDSGKTAEQYSQSLSPGTYAHVGGYYYFYEHPQAACGASQNNLDIQGQTQNAVKAIVANPQAIPI